MWHPDVHNTYFFLCVIDNEKLKLVVTVSWAESQTFLLFAVACVGYIRNELSTVASA